MIMTGKEPEPILSDDEREDYDLSESGDWVEVDDAGSRNADLQAAARRHLAGLPRRRISIAIPERDLLRLKTKAAEKGMPYQTLINSILHEYVEG